MRLLVTRPAPDGERTAAALRSRGHEVMLASLLRIEIAAAAPLGPGPWSAVLVTSAHAVEALAAHPRRAEIAALPVFAVGARTAALLRQAGFAQVAGTAADAAELVRQIRERPRMPGRLLYPAGADRSRDLAAELAPDGVVVDTIEVYRAMAKDAFPPEVAAVLAGGALDGILHFSRRSAEVCIDCARAAGLLDRTLRLAHYCLSGRIAAPLAAAGADRVRIAARPREASLIALIAADG